MFRFGPWALPPGPSAGESLASRTLYGHAVAAQQHPARVVVNYQGSSIENETSRAGSQSTPYVMEVYGGQDAGSTVYLQR